jgi:hypothetical protein
MLKSLFLYPFSHSEDCPLFKHADSPLHSVREASLGISVTVLPEEASTLLLSRDRGTLSSGAPLMSPITTTGWSMSSSQGSHYRSAQSTQVPPHPHPQSPKDASYNAARLFLLTSASLCLSPMALALWELKR